ncbi:MAG TPA: phosphoribosyltransferase family protein [Silvibacterium sp.]|nr:phosphoribosyltransferase family protein [Silvibacterium sp.]
MPAVPDGRSRFRGGGGAWSVRRDDAFAAASDEVRRPEPIAAKLGALLAARVAALPELPGGMLVVPVPLYKGKRRERGFNQSELLARAVAGSLRRLRAGWKGELASGMLIRQRATKSQAGLSNAERRRNVRGVFSVPRPEKLRGRDVLLIDDIYTTGATARACSAALKKAGAASVWVATVARAQRQEIQFAAAAELPMHDDVALWDGSTGQQENG